MARIVIQYLNTQYYPDEIETYLVLRDQVPIMKVYIGQEIIFDSMGLFSYKDMEFIMQEFHKRIRV